MRTILLGVTAFFCTETLLAQTTTYHLHAVAEGNFGVPNGDVFKITVSDDDTLVSGPLYQTANSSTGIDVLQDFQVAGNKAIFISKPFSTPSVVVAHYPSFVHDTTFTGIGFPQSIVKASNNRVYISTDALWTINLGNNTIVQVTDVPGHITGSADYMAAASGYVYMALSSNIVKIDTTTNAVIGILATGFSSIDGMALDSTTQEIWLLGKISGTSSVVKMETGATDVLNAPVTLTGITDAGYLRIANDKLYFLSGKNVYTYDPSTGLAPAAPVYTSTIPGSWDFAYGKSFFVEEGTGNFVLGSANGFASPSLYEIVEGTGFTVVMSGSIAGCTGVNEFMLKTTESMVTAIESEQNIQAGISIYPNPATEKINVQLDNKQYVKLNITDQWGRHVAQYTLSNNHSTVDVSDVKPGIYYLQLEGNKKTVTQKWIIHR